MQALASLDHGWDAVEEYSDFRLLPEGNRTYEIVGVTAGRNKHLGNRPELVVNVTSSEGGGKFEIALAPRDVTDAEGVAKWKRRLKTDLVRLGYTGAPSQLHTYLPKLTGAVIELTVEHVASDKVNQHTGEAYINQRVRLERFVRAAGAAPAVEEVPAAAPASTSDLDALNAAFAAAPTSVYENEDNIPF